jgi:nitrate reductase NapAB chaperone NapD
MTRALELDFQPRPQLARWAQWSVLACGAALAALAVAHELEVQRESRELKARVLAAERPAAAVGTGARRPAAAADSLDARREAILRELNLPWGRVFELVERMASPKVTAVALQPDARNGTVKVVAEAASQSAMLDYVKALSADPGVARVQLVSHEVQTGVPGRPVRFTVIGKLAAQTP